MTRMHCALGAVTPVIAIAWLLGFVLDSAPHKPSDRPAPGDASTDNARHRGVVIVDADGAPDDIEAYRTRALPANPKANPAPDLDAVTMSVEDARALMPGRPSKANAGT